MSFGFRDNFIYFINIVSDNRAFLGATHEARSAKVFAALYELWFLRVVYNSDFPSNAFRNLWIWPIFCVRSVMGFNRENGIRLNVRRYIIFAIATWSNNCTCIRCSYKKRLSSSDTCFTKTLFRFRLLIVDCKMLADYDFVLLGCIAMSLAHINGIPAKMSTSKSFTTKASNSKSIPSLESVK